MSKKKQRHGARKRAKESEDTATKKTKKTRKSGELSLPQKVVVILFVAIFALSTFASSLASMLQTEQSSEIEYNVEYVDEQYTDYVADLEAQLEEDPEDTDTLLSTARAYTSWGSAVAMLAADDDEAAHGTELLEQALEYYDSYLELDNASDARAERALCEYYLGDVETATADLEALTTDDPDYALGWYDLGMLYEAQGLTDEALAAYETCVELDPDDEQGAGESAQSRIDALIEDETDDTDETDDAENSDDASADDASDAQSEDDADASGSGE